MPELPKRVQVENELLQAMEVARQQYRNYGLVKQGEYMAALKTFNDFIMHGKLPDDPKYADLKSRSARA